jgi:glutamate carboxypeptidase
VVEAAHKTLALQALNGRWPGVTVNAGVIEGGTRANVVADRCRLHVDVRSPRDDTFDQALDEVRAIADTSIIDGITSTVEVRDAHRPFEKTEASARLIRLAQEIADELGFEVGDQATGGASDGNTVAAQGVPTLDGLGPIGGDPHGPDEWLDLTSVVPRVSMLAALIARVSGEPLYSSRSEPE